MRYAGAWVFSRLKTFGAFRGGQLYWERSGAAFEKSLSGLGRSLAARRQILHAPASGEFANPLLSHFSPEPKALASGFGASRGLYLNARATHHRLTKR